jgi:excisionase family DNA binding protein
MVAWKRRGPRKIGDERNVDAPLAASAGSPSPTARLATVPAHAAYLSVDEAAAVLRVDRKTIHRAVAAGELPYLRLGRVIRIPSAALATPSKSA